MASLWKLELNKILIIIINKSVYLLKILAQGGSCGLVQ